MKTPTLNAVQSGMRKIERREWVLWSTAVLVTLLLTLGIASFLLPFLRERTPEFDSLHMSIAVRGLVGLVLLFDLYAIYQQFQIYRMRHQLMEREHLFRLISENAADMIAVVDATGKRLYNRNIEYRMRHKNGTWRLMESTASTIQNAMGKVETLIIVNRDITERRHLEEQFRQSQKMEAVGRLSGGIAHDFNNLLGVIIGYAEFLQERLDATNPLRASADEILMAGKRAASLTRQLLAFSRQQVLDPKVLDMNSVVPDMEKLLRRLIGEDIELNTALVPDLGKVKADQGQLEQVIMNLAVNARDAMPGGGRLLLKVENTIMDEEFVRRYPYPVQLGPYVLLTVTDTGCGMDAETKARAFEPFFTTKEKGKGTGLGLSTVYGVVKQSGGYIDIDSAPGVGTTFKIYLPRVHEPLHREKQPSKPAVMKNGNETILVAEDETSLRTLTSTTLELSGYTVLQARDGLDALEVSRKHTGTIDLLLTDMVMPGMGGRVLAEELGRQRRDIKIVYMSGYTGQAVGSQGPVEPGSFYLHKPFTREVLTRKIREALESHVAAQTR
jgi:two-component system cell cycle sensor histidine kinase/response regulator CckA